jgi:sugar phosphate isomerase/epimerase
MKSAITLCLCPEARGGPFALWDSLDEGFERAATLGFDAIELFPASARDLDAAEVRRLSEKYQLKIAAVGTGAGWVKHKLRLADPDPNVRRQARQFIAELVDLAGTLGAPAILGSMQGHWGGGVSRDQAIAWLAAALEELGPRAEALGMPLLFEFLNRYETNLFNRVAESLEFLKTLRAQNIKLLGDLFHMSIEEADMATALRLAGGKLGHVHFADSNRRAVGMGHTNMKPVMAALRDIGYTGYLSAEVLPLPDSLTAARQTIVSFRKLIAET